MYGVTDFNAVLSSNGSFPLAEVYAQATGSKGATFGLLLIILLAIIVCTIGTFVTVSVNLSLGSYDIRSMVSGRTYSLDSGP
jgi:hypothetical protein